MSKKVQPLEVLSKQGKLVYGVVSSESDLACVLILSSYLDECLASILNNYLIENSSVVDRLLNPNGNLGNFQTRSDIAYTLGLIPKSLYQNLIKIGEIRNKFAHSHLEMGFSNADICDLVSELSLPKIKLFKDSKGKVESNISLGDIFPNDVESRNKFNIIAILMADRIILTGLSINHKERETKGW